MEPGQLIRWLSVIFTTLIGLCYAYQIVYLFIPFIIKRKNSKAPAEIIFHRYAVLIAARNEEGVLPYLIDSVRAQDYPPELIDIYVIADNCTDKTAEKAREKGAKIYERFDTSHVGKGFALSYLLESMKSDEVYENYDAFIVLDADNLLEKDYIKQMNLTFCEGYSVLTSYRNTKNFGDNWLSAGYGIWFLHDAVHRNLSRMLLGTSCAVSGTGFLVSRSVLDECGGWKYHTLTEDIEFYTDCVIHGRKIGYCRDAVFYDEQPTELRKSVRQRIRWTQGGIQVSFKYGRQLIGSIFRKRSLREKYSCFENLTMSFWGYSTSVLVMLFSLFTAFKVYRGDGVMMSVALSVAGFTISMLYTAALTVITEWNKIHASPWKKISAVFIFPIFMLSFIPPALCAVFKKFEWTPISHTSTVSVSEVKQAER